VQHRRVLRRRYVGVGQCTSSSNMATAAKVVINNSGSERLPTSDRPAATMTHATSARAQRSHVGATDCCCCCGLTCFYLPVWCQLQQRHYHRHQPPHGILTRVVHKPGQTAAHDNNTPCSKLSHSTGPLVNACRVQVSSKDHLALACKNILAVNS
jgi:hypothetical protein